MTEQAGGNARFKGPGSLWKSSWKGRAPFSQVCCVGGFGADIFGQYYVDNNGPGLDIDPALGWFLGLLVLVSEVPSSNNAIASNGDVANEGWTLTMFDATAGGIPAVGFNLTVYDGAAPAATVLAGPFSLENLDVIGAPIAIPLLFAFEPVSGPSPNGVLHVASGALDALAAPYVNSTPRLLVGRDGLDVLAAPNCLSGLVGGTAKWTQGSTPAQLQATFQEWKELLLAANEVVPVPNTAQPTLVNTNGWRVDSNTVPFTAAPNPWPAFVGAEPLDYANASPPAGGLTLDCSSPFLLWPANINFPYV